MKKLLFVLLFMPLLAWSQNSFDGTWRVDMSKVQLPKKPDKYLLQDGTYKCQTCVPPVEVKADGQDHKVTGHPYYDTMNVRVVDPNTIETTLKKNGKVTGTSKQTVSDNGSTLNEEFTFVPEASGKEQHGKAIRTRVSKGPAGSHAVSGSWQQEKLSDFSQDAITWDYKTSADGMAMKAATGETYDAKFDGKDYPMKGDPGTSSVSLKKIDANTVEETDKRDGKVISVSRMTVSPDGKTMNIDVNDKLHGTTSSFVAVKQ